MKKANMFNKFFAEQCTPLENYSVLTKSQHVPTELRIQSVDFSFEEYRK